MLHFLRRSILFVLLLALATIWIGCTKRIDPVQPINIPDANLRAVIERALLKSAGATITNADMETLTSLEAGRADIRELTGLEFATNLTHLYLADNQIADLSPLAGLTNLKELNLYKNEISDLSPLSRLKNLRFLGISDSTVSDLSPITKLTNLEHLGIHGSQASDLYRPSPG